MRSVLRAAGLGLLERLPFVGVADYNNDGNLQLILGPQPRGVTGKALRELPDKTISAGPFVFVLGVR